MTSLGPGYHMLVQFTQVTECDSTNVISCSRLSQGDMLAVSPYESHHDPRFFHPHPYEYDPSRVGLQCPGSSLHEVPGVGGIAGLVFGGGRYRSATLCGPAHFRFRLITDGLQVDYRWVPATLQVDLQT